jgi:inosose dehydratase
VSFRPGFAPITWNNEDLRNELGPPVPYQTVLDEITSLGYCATELGDGFPRDPRVLQSALAARGLSLPSAWCGLRLFDVAPEEDLAHVRSVCALLPSVGATFVNLADQGTPERKASAGRATDGEGPQLSAREWDQLADRVRQAASLAHTHGLLPLFHQHAGTWVETRADLEELLSRVPADELKLVWDVGHAVYGGMDPIEVVRAHSERIAYIHLKDVDGAVLEALRRERLGFEDGIRRRVFTELGRGLLDVPALLAALGDIGYDGWLMVEQDSTWLAPADSARASREYLRSLGI